jgi:hypothetical protein
MTEEKEYYAVDLDGTLAMYESGDFAKYGGTRIGAPIPKMVERIKEWLAAGEEVRILTARVSEKHRLDVRVDENGVEDIRQAIEDWCLLHIGVRLPVQNFKDGYMKELWDDKAVQVIQNTGERADGRQ